MDGFILNVELSSKSFDITEVVTLKFTEIPPDFEVIRDEIESKCSIPITGQTLYCQGEEILAHSSPSSLYLRSDDSIRIVYQGKGETKDVKSYVKWLKTLSELLNDIKPLNEAEKLLALTTCVELTSQHGNDLSRSVFWPYSLCL